MGLLQDAYKYATRPYQQVGDWVTGGIKNTFGDYSNDTSDRDVYNQQLQSQLGQITPPNLANMFSQYQGNVLGSVKQPTSLADYYGKAKQNLTYNMNTQVGDASAQAGALAASRGFANPSGFVANQAQNVRSSFVPQFGQLESDQAMQTAQQTDEFNRYFTNLLAQLGQGQIGASQNDFSNKLNMFGLQSGLADNYDPYSTQDKYFNFFNSIAPAVAKSAIGG